MNSRGVEDLVVRCGCIIGDKRWVAEWLLGMARAEITGVPRCGTSRRVLPDVNVKTQQTRQ